MDNIFRKQWVEQIEVSCYNMSQGQPRCKVVASRFSEK